MHGFCTGSRGSITGESSIGLAQSETLVAPDGAVIGGLMVLTIETIHGLVVMVVEVVSDYGRPLRRTFCSSTGASSNSSADYFYPTKTISLLSGTLITSKMAEAIGS